MKKTLKKILEDNNIISFDVINDILIGAITDQGDVINLDGDTSNINFGTPVVRETDFTLDGTTLTIKGNTFNTLLIRELKNDINQSEYEDVKQITPAQGMYLLSDLGLLETVENMVLMSNDPKLTIFWQRSVFWEKSSQIIQNMANSLQIDIDEFFYHASLINI
jgi:hypothetical protein